MASIIIPSRRLQQPTGGMAINWNNPLSNLLSGLWYFKDTTIINLVDGKMGINVGCTFTTSDKGASLSTTATTDYAVLAPDWRSMFSAAKGTLGVWCTKRDTTFRTARIVSANDTTSFILQTYTNGTTLYSNWPSTSLSIATPVTGTRMYVVSAGENCRIYNNGNRVHTTASTPNIGAGGNVQLRIGDDTTTDTAEFLDYHLIVSWKRQLSDSEILEWYKNPWLLLKRNPYQIHFDMITTQTPKDIGGLIHLNKTIGGL
jgi:hypothetical protein